MKGERYARPDVAAFLGRILGSALRLLAATWRVEGAAEAKRALRRPGSTPRLIGFWHGKYLPLFPLCRDTEVTIFVGEGFRGRLIAAIARTSGMSPVLLPHGDRERARARMRRALAGSTPCATALDGPIGPPHRVKPALVELASVLGAEIQPIALGARPRLIQFWRWDARELPLPFARVRIVLGDPIRVPGSLRPDQRAVWCERVSQATDALDSSYGPPGVVVTARRVVAAVVGLTLLVVGVVLVFTPGPAILVLILGLATLSAEFAWARRWLRKLRSAVGLSSQAHAESNNAAPPDRGSHEVANR